MKRDHGAGTGISGDCRGESLADAASTRRWAKQSAGAEPGAMAGRLWAGNHAMGDEARVAGTRSLFVGRRYVSNIITCPRILRMLSPQYWC